MGLPQGDRVWNDEGETLMYGNATLRIDHCEPAGNGAVWIVFRDISGMYREAIVHIANAPCLVAVRVQADEVRTFANHGGAPSVMVQLPPESGGYVFTVRPEQVERDGE